MAETTTFISDDHQRVFRMSEIAKRLFDFVVSFVALILLTPVFVWLAWLVHRDSPGPVFYHGDRVGRWGKVFKILKFRTMHEDASSYAGPRLTAAGDVRITPIGKWLRDTKLNELPQLWNVLKGDMSLVGPRPPVPKEVAEYEYTDRRRLDAIPGITCIWQVSGRSEIDFKGQVRLDVQYIENQSFWGDIKLLLKTIPAVLLGKGAY